MFPLNGLILMLLNDHPWLVLSHSYIHMIKCLDNLVKWDHDCFSYTKFVLWGLFVSVKVRFECE